MKRVKWFKESDEIPDAATYLKESRRVVTEWESDHPLMPEYAAEWHYEYLYEVPIEPPSGEE